MKIRPLTIIAFIILAVIGVIYCIDKVNTPKQTTITQQSATPSPTPLVKPNKQLKPNEKFIPQLGLYITVPEEMAYREEITDDAVVQNLGFYIEKKEGEELIYQFYGIYSSLTRASDGMLEKTKTGVDPGSIKNVTVGGFNGVEGLYTGPKSRYSTSIIKDGKLITFSTYPPTLENKNITDQILSTISFQ